MYSYEFDVEKAEVPNHYPCKNDATILKNSLVVPQNIKNYMIQQILGIHLKEKTPYIIKGHRSINLSSEKVNNPDINSKM